MKIRRTEHNGIKCYKDNSDIFMITKEGNRWCLHIAERCDNELLIKNHFWGYKEISYCETLSSAKDEINYLLNSCELGKHISEEQIKLAREY